MKKVVLGLAITAVLFVMGAPYAVADADATLEKALLLNFAEEQDMSDYEVVELLQGYAQYRETMDALVKGKAEKQAALDAAMAADESSSKLMSLTRELMDLDMGILRLKQSSVDEASSVMSAKAVAQLYVLVSNLDAAKAKLVAELSGASAACPMGTGAACPLAGTAACPMANAAAAPAACGAAAAPAASAAAPAVAATPEDILKEAVGFLNKLVAKDLEGALVAVSEDFTHHEYSTKEELKFFLDQVILMGYLDDAKILTTDAEVKLDGDKAVIYPIDVEGSFGSVTLELVVEKKDGKWLLTTMDAFGI